jgi:hypothetical protein
MDHKFYEDINKALLLFLATSFRTSSSTRYTNNFKFDKPDFYTWAGIIPSLCHFPKEKVLSSFL